MKTVLNGLYFLVFTCSIPKHLPHFTGLCRTFMAFPPQQNTPENTLHCTAVVCACSASAFTELHLEYAVGGLTSTNYCIPRT